ncbi:MAG: ribonuclease J, partial [Proteobacteria bacterium]|nr:ribonuclease J [Pseudomonadota bacterium]
FSSEPHFGIMGLFYDITPIIQRFGHPKSYIITHAHRDHIGALTYFLERWPAPIFATPWTIQYIKSDIESSKRIHTSEALQEVRVGSSFSVGCLQCEYISVNHSIPESQSLFIQTPYHRIAHSGDFKIDHETSLETMADLQRWQELASEKQIDVMLCDSTNAHRQGHSPSEEMTKSSLSQVIGEAKGRVFIATFSSNLWRLIHIVETAKAHGRHVEVLGFGMQRTLALAEHFGIYQGYDSPKSHTSTGSEVYVVSGSQMEPGSVLSRVIAGNYGDLIVANGDTVIFSSRTIPGHERALNQAVSQIMWRGGSVVTLKTHENIHVSGHGYATDIDILESVISPRYFIPVHGELSHLISNAKGRTKSDVFLWKNLNGCLLKGEDIYPFALAETFKQIAIDKDYSELPEAALRERRKLARQGVLWLSGIYHLGRKLFTYGPIFDGLGVGKGHLFETMTHDLTNYVHDSIEIWFEKMAAKELNLAPESEDIDAMIKFLKARVESYLQQNYHIKTWVRPHIGFV